MSGAPSTVDRLQDELQFVQKYASRLKTRGKHATIREGRRIPTAMTLPIRITETGEFIGNAQIEELRWLRLRDINSPEILNEEFPKNVLDLVDDLKELYPTLRNDSWVTFFRFRFEGEKPD
jgi:hypothetical protein